MRRFRAFTLIELLIVIAIIAILAAILFPIFARAKAAAKKSTSLSNLKQVGLAFHGYLADYDDTLPFRYEFQPRWPGYDILAFSTEGSLPSRLDPYIKNREIWFSPEDRLLRRGVSSYAENVQLAYAWPFSEITQPAATIQAADRTDLNTFAPDEQPNEVYYWWMFPSPTLPNGHADLPKPTDPAKVAVQISPKRYVGDVGAYLFLDSHVAALPFDRTWGDAKTNMHYPFK